MIQMTTKHCPKALRNTLIKLILIVCTFIIPLLILFICFDHYCPDSLALCFHYPILMLAMAFIFLIFCYWLIFFHADILLNILFKDDKK